MQRTVDQTMAQTMQQLHAMKTMKKKVVGKAEQKFPFITYLKKVLATILGLNLVPFFIIHKNSYWLQRQMLFLHFARWPLFIDFNKFEQFGLKGVKNFYLSTKDKVKVGVWQLLPASYANQSSVTPETFDQVLGDGKPIVVYVHGNSGTRATSHRVQLYKLLQQNECHVITFDYRSFGDSSKVAPDEVGLVEDTSTVLRWVLDRKRSSPVFVWGHSLGTAVGSRTVSEFEKRGDNINGLILESPFNNLEDAIRNHPMSAFLRNAVGYDYFFVKPIQENGITFKTDVYLAASKIPLCILHAADDWVLPSVLGKKLYDYLLQNRPNAEQNVKYVEFAGTGYGHKYICNAPSLLKLINLFLSGQLSEIPASIS